ncbi:MAG: hypothetical protein CMJ72_09615 [Planctomycetaceae bacterium]|nr:hypothetical protein [Planctomycetaceae bacterium]
MDGPHPIRGIIDLSVSNHVQVMSWYYETMRWPTKPCGFQNSVFRCHCGRVSPCCPAAEEASSNDCYSPANEIPTAEVPQPAEEG